MMHPKQCKPTSTWSDVVKEKKEKKNQHLKHLKWGQVYESILHRRLNVIDEESRPLPAQIMEETKEKVLVHFLNHSSKYNVWLPKTSSKLLWSTMKPEIGMHQRQKKETTPDHNCGICFDLCQKPKQAVDCGHLYCTKCLETWHAKSPNQCPQCQCIRSFFPDVRTERQINACVIDCDCGDSLKYQDTVTTSTTFIYCPHSQYDCMDCGASKVHPAMHYQDCPGVNYGCDICGRRHLTFQEFTEHVKQHTSCQLCDQKFQSVEAFCAHPCSMVELTCPFKYYGCYKKFVGFDKLNHHLQTCGRMHQGLLKCEHYG